MSRPHNVTVRWNGLWRVGAGTPDDPNNGRLIFRLTGVNAWLYCRHFDTRMATLRGVYWWLIRRYETELCQHCGRPVRIVFHAPDWIWETVTGIARHPDGESAGGVLCPACVDDIYDVRVPRGDAGFLRWTCRADDRPLFDCPTCATTDAYTRPSPASDFAGRVSLP